MRRGQLPLYSNNKNIVSQVARFELGHAMYLPDLTAYRDYLLTMLSVRAHLSSIRRSYKLLIESLDHRAALVVYLEYQFPYEDFASIKAKTDELELRLMRAIDPQLSPVTTQTIQDEADSQHILLTPEQGAALMMQPDVSPLRRRRDAAIIALMLATGLREGEAIKLKADDLYQTYGGIPAVHVRSGKGAKARMMPFGDMFWA